MGCDMCGDPVKKPDGDSHVMTLLRVKIQQKKQGKFHCEECQKKMASPMPSRPLPESTVDGPVMYRGYYHGESSVDGVKQIAWLIRLQEDYRCRLRCNSADADEWEACGSYEEEKSEGEVKIVKFTIDGAVSGKSPH